MIEIQMNPDTHDFEPRLLGLLTKRQAAFLGIGVALSFPVYVIVPIDDMTVHIVVAAIPLIIMMLAGFAPNPYAGMPMEKAFIYLLQFAFKIPQWRKYETEGIQDISDWTNEGKKTPKPSKEFKAMK